MNFVKKHYGIFIAIFLLLFFCLYLFWDGNKKKTFIYELSYLNTTIYMKLYDLPYQKAKKISNDIKNIYEKYDKITDRKKQSDGNLYAILNSKQKSYHLKIDETLYDMLVYAKSWNEKSDGLFSIHSGDIIDLYENANTFPDDSILEKMTIDDQKIVLLEKPWIENNHPNIVLDTFVLGYANREVLAYLKEERIEKYLINAGGNLLLSKKNPKYKIALEDAFENQYFKFLEIENKAISTKGSDDKYYILDGKKYTKWIDPTTYKPANKMKVVTVIGEDPLLCDTLSIILFFKTPEEGDTFMKNYPNTDVIWYTNEGTLIEKSY